MPAMNPGQTVGGLTPDTGNSDAYDQDASGSPADLSNDPS